MTNYNLEEFKAWLEAKPERKAGLDWTAHLSAWITQPENFQALVKAAQGNPVNNFYISSHRQAQREVIKKWLAERERERESKAKMRRKTLIW